ncbi:MAG: NAD-dependent epimerase/dehydratase family protein [Lentisphaerae bacterium]|nr:NAD-dependent epimerase/dehydratase family protein [Lentisphaerota bacterium]
MDYKRILVTGGAGYVGSVLIPRLLERGQRVRNLDLYIYGEEPLAPVRGNPLLEEIKGDIRDPDLLARALEDCDGVIHLACISNDPSVELDPDLSRTINLDAFVTLTGLAKERGLRRFIFASSGSVYGVSEDPDVTEEHPLVPVSLYNKYKMKCEEHLKPLMDDGFPAVVVRPATICGYSPRQRLDLTVNILTTYAVERGKITVFGGSQMRPNLHMLDMVDLYLQLLDEPGERVEGEVFNAAYQNFSVAETARIVRDVVQAEMPERGEIEIETTESNDIRSYHISSEKIRRVLGFHPRKRVEDAVMDLIRAFREGKLPHPLDDIRYYNIKQMKAIHLA